MDPRPFPVADLDELTDLTPSPWAALTGGRIFLTGASGLVGRWLLESLLHVNDRLRLGVELTLLLRNPDAWRRAAPRTANHPAVTVWPGDARTCPPPPGRFTHWVHLAASSDAATQHADPLDCFDTITAGTRHMLELAARAGARRFLFASSGAVYGRTDGGVPVAEECAGGPDPMDPGAVYAEAKRAAEMTCALYNRLGRVETVSARLFAVMGPGLPPDRHFAAGNFLRDALAGGPVRVTGDGTPVRSYLYGSDMAWWFWTLLAAGAPGRAYQVGGDEAVTIRRLAERIARAASPAMAVTVERTPVPGAVASYYVPSLERARRELGLRVRIGLDEAIRRTLAWHRESTLGLS